MQCLYSTSTVKQIYIENFARLLLGWISQKMSQNMKTKTKKNKNKNKKVYKKEKKSRSLLVLNVHPVTLILSFSQLAVRLEASLNVKHFFFWVLIFMYSVIFFFSTTNFGVVEHKGSEIYSTTSKMFNIYLNC